MAFKGVNKQNSGAKKIIAKAADKRHKSSYAKAFKQGFHERGSYHESAFRLNLIYMRDATLAYSIEVSLLPARGEGARRAVEG